MSKQHIFVGKIRNSARLREMPEAGTLPDDEGPVSVSFDDDRTGYIDPTYPRALVWARMIDYLQETDRPVYVEIDDETNIITKLFIPAAARVREIIPSDQEGVVYVTFHTSQARHYLRRNHPDFQKMLDALQAAKDSGSEVLVTATHHDFEIIDVRPLPSSFGPGTSAGPSSDPPPPPGPATAVTFDRALDLFNMMKAETCTPCASVAPCITYKYPYNGCWIRAHLMCFLMMAEGETPEKVWINGSLLAPSVNVPDCLVPWSWHVAPTLMVTPTSGPAIKMVIDPSLCEGPATPEEWKSLQGDAGASLSYTSWTNYFQSGGTATQAQAYTDMQAFRLLLDEMCATYGPSPYACPILKRSFFIIDRSTISKDEVEAMLSISAPAVIEAAFYVIVEGFTPAELGITVATLSGIPNIKPTLTISPSIAQMTIDVMPTIGLEDPTRLIRRQRITWKYKISFTGTGGFAGEVTAVNLAASLSTVTANAGISLIKQPNPYEIDGATAWLSTDLRVFQLNAGASRFNRTMGTDASDFITGVVQNLNSGNTAGQTFEGISENQQTSRLELSETVGGVRVYNFAVAKVRYRALSVQAQDVRVFFRLFPASSTSLEYNQATTYRRATQGGAVKPLLGIVSGEATTFPCFAAPRIDSSSASMTQQTDPANVQTIPPNAGGAEVVRYFGCWLDFNQTQPQFPINPAPADGPFPANSRLSLQEHIRNEHQCLVAEIAFDPTPIPAAASPSISDKLAQRNLAIVTSANPGDLASHRIPHTFEIRPTQRMQGSDEEEVPDELMIDWGNTPAGSTATLYLPRVKTNDILNLAVATYRPDTLLRIDAHTLQCETGGITYIPIPHGEGAKYAGLMSVDLPKTVKKGQSFKIVVHQVTGAGGGQVIIKQKPAAAIPGKGVRRRILGSFQITIPVSMKEAMVVHEERLLSNLLWIQRAIPTDNRWYAVFNRYVKQIAGRVDALGGDSGKVIPSPSDRWRERPGYSKHHLLVAALSVVLLVVIGSLTISVFRKKKGLVK